MQEEPLNQASLQVDAENVPIGLAVARIRAQVEEVIRAVRREGRIVGARWASEAASFTQFAELDDAIQINGAAFRIDHDWCAEIEEHFAQEHVACMRAYDSVNRAAAEGFAEGAVLVWRRIQATLKANRTEVPTQGHHGHEIAPQQAADDADEGDRDDQYPPGTYEIDRGDSDFPHDVVAIYEKLRRATTSHPRRTLKKKSAVAVRPMHSAPKVKS